MIAHHSFLRQVSFHHSMNPTLRFGQVLFNTLADHRPDLADRIRASGIDPFYFEKGPKVSAALSFIEKEW